MTEAMTTNRSCFHHFLKYILFHRQHEVSVGVMGFPRFTVERPTCAPSKIKSPAIVRTFDDTYNPLARGLGID